MIRDASAVPAGSGGVVFLPHLANGPPPEPDPHGRGAFVGLTQTTTPAALYRAVLEGVALQSRLMLDGMTGLPGVGNAGEIRLIGGASRNRLFVQIKADVFGRPLTVVDDAEATTLGAALLGGVAAGLWPDLDAALAELERRDHVVAPQRGVIDRYDALRTTVFEPLQPALKPLNRALAEQAQGSG